MNEKQIEMVEQYFKDYSYHDEYSDLLVSFSDAADLIDFIKEIMDGE